MSVTTIRRNGFTSFDVIVEGEVWTKWRNGIKDRKRYKDINNVVRHRGDCGVYMLNHW